MTDKEIQIINPTGISIHFLQICAGLVVFHSARRLSITMTFARLLNCANPQQLARQEKLPQDGSA
jgi:hypothetical protein